MGITGDGGRQKPCVVWDNDCIATYCRLVGVMRFDRLATQAQLIKRAWPDTC
jgi:hypothetical protein